MEPGAGRAREREANVFPVELLMPEALVRAAYADTPEIDEIATLFGGSREAMHWRLYNFELVERPATS